MFPVSNISSCKHSSVCLLLCSSHVFVSGVLKWGNPRHVVQCYRNWCELCLWFQLETDQDFNLVFKWGLSFCKALPQSEIPCSVKGDSEACAWWCRSCVSSPAVFTGSPMAVSCSTHIWYWAVLIPKAEMPFLVHGSLCQVPIYPLVNIEIPVSSAVKNGKKPRRDQMWAEMSTKHSHRRKEKPQHMHRAWIISRVTETDTNSWVVIISVSGLDQVVCSSTCASQVQCWAFLVVAMEIYPAYLVVMRFTPHSGDAQKFALKCCESFNLRTCDFFTLKRLLRKKCHFSVHSCFSINHHTKHWNARKLE